MTIVTLSRRAALAAPQPVDADPAEHESQQEQDPAPVGDDEPDAEPGRVLDLVRKVVPALQLVEPLPGEPHQDQARQADEEKREVAEAKQPNLAASQRERSRARQQGAEHDGRADEVEQKREVLVGGRIAASISGTRLPDHVDDDQHDRCRREGAQQEPGRRSVQRSELGTRAGLAGSDERSRLSAGFPYSATARTIAAVAMHQRTIAAITQPSHGWKSTRRIASQIPKPMTPTRPTHGRGSDHRDPVEAERRVRGVGRAQRDDDDPGHDERADERRREQQMNREDPVFEGHCEATSRMISPKEEPDGGALGIAVT